MSVNPLAGVGAWDNVADGYDEFAAPMMEPFALRALEIADPAPGARIVDVATGTGLLAFAAAERGTEVQALDFSAAMIDRVRARAEAKGVTDLVAVVGDGQALPYGDDTFDAGFSMFGLMFFPDRARGFAELRRVLRPGGIAVVASWAPIAESPLMSLLFGAYQAGIPDFPAPRPNPDSLENPEVFESELAASGFTEIRVRPQSVAVAYDSAAELWEGITRHSAALQLTRRRTAAATWKAQEDIMIRYLEENYRPGEELSTTAWLGSGRKPATTI
ncbi:class I SAM-dependent methyltransferase [Nocardia huaxiensis]|uniref:Methyltransferase domain-containing protein n=1 Tax=Nocardia huaxiensis TaxID=2755382 RepID=A0A7D6V7D4_9NOCA|nr:methyltransferase domain-containing protein [Nocardia huaxiensis]QLY28231.1 methyltransferase domain-containing protein [Nocardia huaxiensis]UFS98334.1 methyltransferase domain-containing protein [Nocardia huaxiensis]